MLSTTQLGVPVSGFEPGGFQHLPFCFYNMLHHVLQALRSVPGISKCPLNGDCGCYCCFIIMRVALWPQYLIHSVTFQTHSNFCHFCCKTLEFPRLIFFPFLQLLQSTGATAKRAGISGNRII